MTQARCRHVPQMIYSIPATFTTGKVRLPSKASSYVNVLGVVLLSACPLLRHGMQAIKGKPAWAPESGDLPQPLSIEQYTDAQQVRAAADAQRHTAASS